MTTAARQITITIPEGVVPGAILQVPVKSSQEKIKVRVPESMSAGSQLVLTKVEGTDEWVEESIDARRPSAGSMVQRSQSQPLEAPPVNPQPVAYTVRLDTTVGIIDIIVRPDWSPHGARRFLDLAAVGDLDNLAFYRSVKGCLAQFGLPARRPWPPLPDDPRVGTGVPFLLGAVCFAAVGPNSRKSTLFICIGDMSHVFGQQAWETPIGAIAESSLDVLDRIETCYGDIAECGGTGPDTSRINTEGSAYLRSEFPLLTFIRSAWPLDWQPPPQEGEQRHTGALWNQPLRLPDSPKAIAESSSQGESLDTSAMLRKLEEQEKAHTAAMKEMEKKILEVQKAAQRVNASTNSNSKSEDSASSSTAAAGSLTRAAISPPRMVVSPRTNLSEQSREFSHGGKSVPVAVDIVQEKQLAMMNTPTKKFEVALETLSSSPAPAIVDVPIQVTPVRRSIRGNREVHVEVSSPRVSREVPVEVSSPRGSREVQVEVSRSLSPRGQRSSINEMSFSDHQSVAEGSIRFAPPDVPRHYDANLVNTRHAPFVGQPSVQPGQVDHRIPHSQHLPQGMHAPHSQAHIAGHLSGPRLGGYLEYGAKSNQHVPLGPPVPQNPAMHPPLHQYFAQTAPPPVPQMGPPPQSFPWQGAPPSVPPNQSPRMSYRGPGISDTAQAGVAALAPGNIRMQSAPQNFAPGRPHFQPTLGPMGFN